MFVNRKISLIILVLFSSLVLKSQHKVLYPPYKYNNPFNDISLSTETDLRKGELWVVYSDRNNNITYSEANDASATKQTINFMDNFYVIGETDEYVNIAKGNIKINEIVSAFRDFGWIKKTNILLWSNCLVDNVRSKINQKAMVLNTMEAISNFNASSNTSLVQFFKNPDLTELTPNESKLFNIFFIYKRDKSSVLLGVNPLLSDIDDPKRIILGWAPINRIKVWNSRIAFEPNSVDTAALERKNFNLKASAFKEQLDAKRFIKDPQNNMDNAIWSSDDYNKRKKGEWRRFPILEKYKNDDIYKVCIMGEIKSAEGETLLSADQNADIQQKYNDKRAKTRHINIVFCIDATKSMGTYFKPVANIISNTMKNLKTKNDISFGAVVYRDSQNGEFLSERKPVSPNESEVISWLNSVYSDKKWEGDGDVPEAVNYGIREALKNTGLKKGESNFIILVGDAGNHHRPGDKSLVSPEEIIKLIIEKDAHLLAYQVHNDARQNAYANFTTEIKNILILSSRQIYNNEKERNALLLKSRLPEPVFKNIDDSKFKGNAWKLSNSALQGMVFGCNPGTELAPDWIQKCVEDMIKYSSEEYTEKILNVTNDAIMAGSNFQNALEKSAPSDQFVDNYAPAISHYLNQLNLTPDQLRIINNEKYQSAISAYIPNKVDGIKTQMFQPVLFVTQNELSDICHDLNELLKSTGDNEARESMKNAWISLLKEHTGDPEDKILSYSANDINLKLFGLPSTSHLLDNLNLKEITDRAKFPDDKLNQYSSRIRTKLKILQNWLSNNDEYSFKSNDEVYHWVSQDNLP